MTDLLTAAQMRAIEQAAIDNGEVTGLELMERAGRGVVDAIFEEWPELRETSHRAVVLCGPGNNGGDGFVVARLLKEWGWEVEVFLYGDPERLPPDAKTNYERCAVLLDICAIEDDEAQFEDAFTRLGSQDLIVDALFGTGLARPFYTLPKTQMALNDCGHFSLKEPNYPYAVAIDLPSGFDGSSGRYLTDETVDERNAFSFAPRANLTVSFHRGKLGHVLANGAEQCGKLRLVDIGLEGSPRPRAGEKPPPGGAVGGCPAAPPGERVELIGAPPNRLTKQTHTHKYTQGHALILSGPAGKTGASRLAARGALRIGAGLVTLTGPASAQAEQCAQVTAIMWREIKGAPGLTELLEDDRNNALCLGPGLGIGHSTAHLTLAALEAKRATVLDADALTQFERNPQVLFDALHDQCVLTPHAGEFARLFPDIAEKLNAPATKGPAYSKVDATREAAKRAGCTVLFKGPDTVIATPDGQARINSAHYDRAAPWLATAGSGDVLAGLITGLLARGFAPVDAAATAAWLHVECALSFGPGLIAEDLPEELPKVFRSLGL